MAIILIPAAFLLLSACFLCLKGVGFRESILKAALAMLVIIAISTEVLSRFRAIAPHPVAVLWQTVNLLALSFLLYLSMRRNGTRRMARKLRWLWSRTVLTRRAAVFVMLTMMVVFLTLITAALRYPSDADSLSYHMPRVANWGIRLQLPWFLLMMPLVAVVCFRIRLPRPFRALLQVGLAAALFIGALPALLFDQDVPLWQTAKAPLFLRDAESIRLCSTTPLLSGKSAQSEAVEFVRPFHADEVGLLVPRDNASCDYNWWVLFGNHARPGKPLLRHVAPDTWPQPAYPPPEFVIAAGRDPENGQIMGLPYKEVLRRGNVRVYARSH